MQIFSRCNGLRISRLEKDQTFHDRRSLVYHVLTHLGHLIS